MITVSIRYTPRRSGWPRVIEQQHTNLKEAIKSADAIANDKQVPVALVVRYKNGAFKLHSVREPLSR